MSRTLVLVAISVAAVSAAGLFAHHPPPECGLPPFVNDLPADDQTKLKDIWKNWKEGDKCYHEQGLTRDLVETLPTEIRRKISKDALLPPPVRKAPEDVQEQFRKIINDKTIPVEEKHKKMNELAQKVLTGDNLKEYNEFTAHIEDRHKAVADKAATLSPEAKAAYDKIAKLEKEKHDIIASLNEQAQEELFQVFKLRHSKSAKD
nr:Hypothetical protein CBG17730 [Haemonchus contortus]